MSNYWKQREIQQRVKLLDGSIHTTEAQIIREYRRIQTSITKDMELLYDKIMRTSNPLASDMYKFNEYWDLINSIQTKLQSMGVREELILENKFGKLYEYNYSMTTPEFKITSPSPERVKEVINAVWVNDGDNWSSRVWKDKKLLANKLEELLTDSVVKGVSNDRLTEEIMKTFGQSYNRASTLIRTEMSHIWNQSALDKYKDAGIEKVMFLSEIDCCDECKSYNNTVYELDKVPIIPVHPNCRCTYLAYFD